MFFKNVLESFCFDAVSGMGCSASVPYTDRAREGFTSFASDMKSSPMNPLLQHLADHPAESLAWVPPSLPERFSVRHDLDLKLQGSRNTTQANHKDACLVAFSLFFFCLERTLSLFPFRTFAFHVSHLPSKLWYRSSLSI